MRTEPTTLDHEYDGIREFDNPTPGWWHAIFIATTVFSIFYLLFWHASPASWTIHEAWEQNQVAEYRRIFGSVGNLQADEPTILRMAGDPDMMAVAKGLFVGNCAACHGRDGGGINGVNLTDNVYKNAKGVLDLYTVITNGANLGAMPAWKGKLSDNERVLLAGYVATLRGKNAPGRPPEGEFTPPPWTITPKGTQ